MFSTSKKTLFEQKKKKRQNTLRENSPNLEFFWFVFSRIRTEYGKMFHISLYSVQMLENTDQKNSKYEPFLRSDKHTFHAAILFHTEIYK